MTQSKLIEIRDAGTFIPALATLVTVTGEQCDYLLRRAGWGVGQRFIMLAKLVDRECQDDPFRWGQNPRTMFVAHAALAGHPLQKMDPDNIDPDRLKQFTFAALESGGVLDVEYILGLTDTVKESEQML